MTNHHCDQENFLQQLTVNDRQPIYSQKEKLKQHPELVKKTNQLN